MQTKQQTKNQNEQQYKTEHNVWQKEGAGDGACKFFFKATPFKLAINIASALFISELYWKSTKK